MFTDFNTYEKILSLQDFWHKELKIKNIIILVFFNILHAKCIYNFSISLLENYKA